MKSLNYFNAPQLDIVNRSVNVAEDIVSDYYKIGSTHWRNSRYDVKTLADLDKSEVVEGPMAQVVRYACFRNSNLLCFDSYDFYKICLQDNAILNALVNNPGMKLFPLVVYIITHELIHIIRFSRFMQLYHEERCNFVQDEEYIVHEKTFKILKESGVKMLNDVFTIYSGWIDNGELRRKFQHEA